MNKEMWSNLRESPWVVTIPLLVLAIPSLALGARFAGPVLFDNYFAEAIYVAEANDVLARLGADYQGPWYAVAWRFFAHAVIHPVIIALTAGGVLTAWLLYIKFPQAPEKIARFMKPFHYALKNKYGFDGFNQRVFVGGARLVGRLLWRHGDAGLIDGLIVNGSALSVKRFSGLVRRAQSGYLYHYAFVMIVGLLALMVAFVFV